MKKDKVGGLILFDSKLTTKLEWSSQCGSHEASHIGQRNRIEKLEITYGDKRIFSRNGARRIEYPYIKACTWKPAMKCKKI